MKDQINSLQNEIQFLREKLKVKNHPLELTITFKKIDSITTYPSIQQIGHHTQNISDEKRCCSININGSNNSITIKPLPQKDSVEISLEGIYNNDIAKNNAREEKPVATNATEINKDICDTTQNNIVVDHIKNDTKNVNGKQLYHNLSKHTRERNDSHFNVCIKNSSKKWRYSIATRKNSRPPRKSAFIVGDSVLKKTDGYLLTSSINHKYMVKVRPFVTAKTDDMHDHMKPAQRNFQPNVYIHM